MLTQRLGSSTQKSSKFIDSLIAEIKAHPGCCDEVWFATDYGFPPLETHAADAALLAESAEKFRRAGVRVSLQLSNSIGHGQYMRCRDCTGLVSPESKVRHMVDANGTEAGYCFCWNDEVFRNYTFSALAHYLRAVKPYCLWVDDDLRATNHDPVHHGCFCPECIALFNERYGTDFDREGLAKAVNEDIETRKKHIEFLRDTLADFTYNLGLVVKKEAPDCRMGLQSCANGGYTGYGNGFLLEAMEKATGKPAGYRAGGGAYSDYSPRDFINKASFLAFQHMMLPEGVEDRRPEIENLPDVVFGKSIAGTCFETTCYFIAGATAMSYAMLMNDYEPMKWHGEMLGAFAAHREYWQKLSDVSRHGRAAGLAPFYPKTAFLRKCEKPFEYSRENIFFAEDLRFCAVPVAITEREAKIYALDGKTAEALSEKEAVYLLSKNVVCDGEAIAVLAARGVLKSINAEEISVQELRERFTFHPVNKGREGRTWGGQIWRQTDYRITGDNLEITGEYYSAASGESKTAGISSAVFTTGKGAKWAVFGFDMWERTKSTEKRAQLLETCEYISGERFCAELITPLQACICPVTDENGKLTAVSVVNCTVGESGELVVEAKADINAGFTFMSMTQPETVLKAENAGNGRVRLRLPSIDGWSAGTVFIN